MFGTATRWASSASSRSTARVADHPVLALLRDEHGVAWIDQFVEIQSGHPWILRGYRAIVHAWRAQGGFGGSVSDGPSDYDRGVELPKIISVDDHVVEPPHVWQTWLPERVPRPGPAGRAPGHRHRCSTSAAAPTSRPSTPTGPQGRLLDLRGPRLHPQAPRRRRRLRPRRDDAVADHLRRDAPGLLRPEGPPRGHGRSTGSRRRCASRRSPASAARPSPRPRTASSAWPACAPTTTGWSRSGAATPAAASSRSCIIPLWDADAGRRRGAAQRRPRRARRVLQRDPATPRPARASTPATGIRSSPRAPRPTRSSACTSARRRRCRPPRPTRPPPSRPRSASTTPWRR